MTRRPEKSIIIEDTLYLLVYTRNIASDIWLAVYSSGDQHSLTSCTPRIMAEGSPFRLQGYGVAYCGEEYDYIMERLEAETSHLKTKYSIS